MSEVEPLSILIVDDDPSALVLLDRHLTSAGYKVLTATNGTEALRILMSEGTPIVVTDWVMPNMDGLELCRAIRSREGISVAYVVIVTAHRTSDDRLVEAFEAGADDYLCKPYKPEELLARLHAGERIVRLQRELDTRNRAVHRYNAEMEVVNNKLKAANNELHCMATTDELTGLINRREALKRLSDCWATTQRHGDPLACIALDIDYFKSCNDTYGHAVGDLVLKETASALQASARRGENVCRIGGEEFLVVCPRATEAMAAVGAERLRRVVEDNVVQFGDRTVRCTISAGVAERTANTTCPDDLLRAADSALYAAKNAGRNIVCRASDESERPSPRDDILDATEASAPPARVTPDAPAIVLVADDDDTMRSLYRRSLERAGHRVIEAVDGADALDKVNLEVPDVIIMDALMPKMDGLACTRKLKADVNLRDIPVVIASAQTDAADIIAGFEAGADEYLRKPLHPKELAVRVSMMVRLKRELGQSNEVRGEQSRTLSLLSEFSRDITAVNSFDDVLEGTLNVIAALTTCRRVSIMLPDEDRRYLTVAKCLGSDMDAIADIRVPIGTAVSGKVFQTGKPVVIETSRDAKRHRHDPDYDLISSVPGLSVALCTPECVVGIVNLTGRPGARALTPVELDYIDLTCNIAAAAIHERLTRRARDEARYSIMVALAKLAEDRHMETGRHVDRVTRFSCLLAERLRLDERFRTTITDEFIADLGHAVPLHDIGKVAIPDSVLLKPGPLTPQEIAIVRSHTTIGARTIRSVLERVHGVAFLSMAEEIVHGHHEWYNGQGYPRGLRGDAIPLSARLVAVTDVYDAVTTKRVYKEAMAHERAVVIIREASGTQFDPDIVSALLNREAEFKRLAAELADDTPPDLLPDNIRNAQPEPLPLVVQT